MRVRHFAAILCSVLSVSAVVAACDKTDPGNPKSAPDQTSTGTTEVSEPPSSSDTALPFSGAPKVAGPLDASAYVQDPCRTLTVSQIAKLNVGKGEESTEDSQPLCAWSNPDTGSYVDLRFFGNSREGLSAIYRSNGEGKFEVFKPVGTVDGFPAVVVAIRDASSNGTCIFDIGLSDELATQITVKESDVKRGSVDPCDVTKAVAQEMLQTMKAGA